MANVTDPPRVVAKMMAERDDGSLAPIVWLVWPEEDENSAAAYELLPDGRLMECALGKLSDWRKVAALAAEGGG